MRGHQIQTDQKRAAAIGRGQPATTAITAITAITQLARSEDMTRAVREPDDDRGEIIERFFFWWGFEMNEMRWRGHTNDTIDKNKAMGSAHSRTSACVSAQHAPTDRDDPTTWTWFTSCLLQMECTDFKRSAGTSSRPCRMPVGSLGHRGAIHTTAREDMHVSCQSRRFFSKKTKKRVSRPETLFFIDATSFLATP